jgi:hypothetical protein
VKKDLKGNVIRYKARLVVQGSFQIFGVDYTDTYSPVAKFVSIRIILALCVQLGLIIHTMDVDTAFLNAELDEDIWVKIPEGTRLAVGDDGIYKLVKSLYGLKQASRCRNNLINAYLIEKGFKRMEADPCIYIKEFQVDDKGVQKTQYQIVALYVDDLIIAASTKHLLTALEGVFESRLVWVYTMTRIVILYMLLNNNTLKNHLNNLTSMVSARFEHRWTIERSIPSRRCLKQDQLKHCR